MASRYGSSKQIDPIGAHGELLIDYCVYDAKKAGFETVVFIIKEADEVEFKRAIGHRLERFMEVRYAYQHIDDVPKGCAVPKDRVKPLGTAHAIYAARVAISEPFAVINADDYYGAKAFADVYEHLSRERVGTAPEFCMVSYRLCNTLSSNGHVTRGICKLSLDSYLLDIEEKMKIAKVGDVIKSLDDGEVLDDKMPVSMNIWGFTQDFFGFVEEKLCVFLNKLCDHESALTDEFILPTLIGDLISSSTVSVKAYESLDIWSGMTYKEDKAIVQATIARKIANGEYPKELWG